MSMLWRMELFIIIYIFNVYMNLILLRWDMSIHQREVSGNLASFQATTSGQTVQRWLRLTKTSISSSMLLLVVTFSRMAALMPMATNPGTATMFLDQWSGFGRQDRTGCLPGTWAQMSGPWKSTTLEFGPCNIVSANKVWFSVGWHDVGKVFKEIAMLHWTTQWGVGCSIIYLLFSYSSQEIIHCQLIQQGPSQRDI